jgi:type I restriction enzyme S subunit
MATPIRADDVLLTSEAPLGEVAYLQREVDWCLGQRLFCIRTDKRKLHGRYLFYCLRGEPSRTDLLARATGTTVQGIRQSELRRVGIPLRPLPEQKRIAHILGTLDDKIDLNRRMNATLEGISRAIFKSWFVDFDPVRQKAAGQQPVGMDAQTAALFPDSFEDSEIGEVPKGWTVGSILEQASLLSGGTPKTDEPSYWGGAISWASAKDVSQCGDSFLAITERTITDQGVENSATKILPAKTTVVVSRGATTGRMAMLANEMAINQTCYGLHSTINTPFALYCHTQSFVDRLVNAAHGSVFDTITTRTFETMPVLLAPSNLLSAFESSVTGLFGRVRCNILQTRTLAALRDTVLPKLLSGEIRVPEAEQAVEEAIA